MRQKLLRNVLLSIASALALAVTCHAEGNGDFDIDAKFRARLIKERSKLAAIQGANAPSAGAGAASGAGSVTECGAQGSGGIDSGSAPRDGFVFAPNSIIPVTARGCK